MSQFVIFAPIRGFFYFIISPRLWVRPIVATLIGSLFLGFVFWIFSFSFWPSDLISGWHYVWKSFSAIGLAAVITTFFWVLVVPLFFGFAFDSVVEKTLENKNLLSDAQAVTYFESLRAGFLLMMKTVGWRLFWPLLTLLFLFFFPMLTVLVGSLGMGHSTVMDATGMTLSYFGYTGEEQVKFIKKRSGKFFWMGMAAGIGNFILIPTLFIWLFWVPGIFVGTAIWVGGHIKENKADKA